jgi:hypothetical protein
MNATTQAKPAPTHPLAVKVEVVELKKLGTQVMEFDAERNLVAINGQPVRK